MNTGDKSLAIIIPIGPHKAYQKYLQECLDSIAAQGWDNRPDEIWLIDDQAHLGTWDPPLQFHKDNPIIEIWKTPWLSGCAMAWNFGIALSNCEYNLLMGSDDKLLPDCLKVCRDTIDSADFDPLGYYNLPIVTSEGEEADAFNNFAFVSKALWRLTGGFPLQGVIGAPDAALISIMLKHLPQHLHQVEPKKPYCWCRVHPDQDTLRLAGRYNWIVIQLRDDVTREWRRPDWTAIYE